MTQELLKEGESFDDVFSSFDAEPLGAASVAQVHRATLTEAYGGRTVAVKVQRPAIEPKLLGDVANLKNLARYFRNVEARLPPPAPPVPPFSRCRHHPSFAPWRRKPFLKAARLLPPVASPHHSPRAPPPPRPSGDPCRLLRRLLRARGPAR